MGKEVRNQPVGGFANVAEGRIRQTFWRRPRTSTKSSIHAASDHMLYKVVSQHRQ
jgi:hypothetical protein